MPLTSLVHSSRRQLFRATLDLLFPPMCAFCQNELESQQLPPALCFDCRKLLATPVDQLCGRCGRRRRTTSLSSISTTAARTPSDTSPDGCPGCRNERNGFERVICLGPYQSLLREAIVRMKHGGQQSLTAAVGGFLGQRACQQWQHDPPHLLVPLPMHWKRQLLRGPGSSLILSESMQKETGIALQRGILVCKRATKKQSTLSPLQRRKNVKGAFGLSRTAALKCRDQHVCLIDDTLTTGATANEAAKALRRAEARAVSVVVAARAVEHD